MTTRSPDYDVTDYQGENIPTVYARPQDYDEAAKLRRACARLLFAAAVFGLGLLAGRLLLAWVFG